MVSGLGCRLLNAVIGGFASDHYVMHMALAQAGSADAHEARLLLQFGDGGTACVTHSAFYPTHELVHDHADSATIGNASFDAFWNELGETVAVGAVLQQDRNRGIRIGVLEVAFAGALGHRGQRSHPAIGLERAPLIKNGFARALFGAGEQRADHDAVCARRDRLGDVSGVLDSAVSDNGNISITYSAGRFGDGGDLRNSGAGYYASGAD